MLHILLYTSNTEPHSLTHSLAHTFIRSFIMSATDAQFNTSASPSSTERREGGGKEDEREDNIIDT